MGLFERLTSYLGLKTVASLVAGSAILWYLWQPRGTSHVLQMDSIPTLPKKKRKIVYKGKYKNIKIFYGSQTGTCKNFSELLCTECIKLGLNTEVIDLADYDPDDKLSDEAVDDCICVFIISTYTDGVPPESAKWFCQWVEEAAADFRVQKSLLHKMQYAVVALGNSLYKDSFCKVNVITVALISGFSGLNYQNV